MFFLARLCDVMFYNTNIFLVKVRWVLLVTKDIEGDVEVFIYDANTLSTLVAEQEAKNEAKKKKFRYFDVVSVKPLL